MALRGTPLPLISIGAIVDSGVLQPGAPGELPFVCPSASGVVSFDRASGLATIVAKTEHGSQTFKQAVVFRKRKFGNRAFFKCSCCGQERVFLVLFEERVGCAEHYMTLVGSVPKTHRRALLLEARELLKQQPRRPRPKHAPPESEETGEARSSMRREPAPKLPPKRPMTAYDLTTERALILGRGFGDYRIVREYESSRSEMRYERLPEVYARPDHMAPMMNAPVLDIRVLCRENRLGEEGLRARTLGWPDEYTSGHLILLIQDARAEDPFLMIAHQAEVRDDPRWQRIEIFRLPNGRLRFRCPVSTKACDLLYLRNGSFASWEMQRLYHPSQRKTQMRSAPAP